MERQHLPDIAGYVNRPRVNALLESSLKYALALVVAGPGYGKTLSVAHFFRRANVTLVWVRISNHRKGTAEFWEDFVRAAKTELPDYARKLGELGFPITSGHFELFRQITAAVAESPKRLVFVVDNYERIADADVIGFWNNLIDSNLTNFTLYILCNAKLPFAEVFAEKGQFRISDADLAFTVDEAQTMFELYGAENPQRDAEKAMAETGGWPLGLRLVCAAAGEGGKNFADSPSIQIAAELFEQHYFRNYPPEIQMQLIHFSLFPQFSLEMVVSELQAYTNTFYDVLFKHPFVSYDYADGLFTFQPMYHDFLRQKQALASAETRRNLSASAGRWFLKHQMLNVAMDCFWEASDYDGLLEAVTQLPKVRCPVSQTNPILQRLEQIPRDYADSHPLVDFSIAFMYLNAAEAKKARGLFLELATRLQAGSQTEDARLMLGDIYATLADISTYLNEDTGMGWMEKAFQLIPQGTRTHSAELMAVGNNSTFYLPGPEAGQVAHMVDYMMAYALYNDKVMNGCGYGYEYLFAGEAAFCQEDMDKAAIMFNSAIMKAQQTWQHDIICNAMFGLARIELYYGNYKTTLAQLDEIAAYVDEKELLGLYELRDCAFAWFYLHLGDHDKIPAWFHNTLAGPEEFPVSIGRNRITAAFTLFFSGESAKAYALLLQLAPIFENNGRWYEKFCLYILQALCHLNTCDDAAFDAAFFKAYSMVHQNNLKMLLAEFGKEAMTIIDHVKKLALPHYDMAWLEAAGRDALSFAKRIQALRRSYTGSGHGYVRSALALTKREDETLRYLAQGLTQQEIAKLMGISGNAVKKHVAKIYQKLGAVNRADAIHIASINGLVDDISG